MGCSCASNCPRRILPGRRVTSSKEEKKRCGRRKEEKAKKKRKKKEEEGEDWPKAASSVGDEKMNERRNE